MTGRPEAVNRSTNRSTDRIVCLLSISPERANVEDDDGTLSTPQEFVRNSSVVWDRMETLRAGREAMIRNFFFTMTLLTTVVTIAPAAARAQDVPAEYKQVLTTLGKQGDFKDNVLKVNIPRNDVKVSVAGVATPTPFGFGGWVAMTKGDGGQQVLMGDLVLLQDEVNPVMSALLDNGFDVTALHNHFFWDEPRMYYMHVHGHGTAADLAQKLKPALALIGKSTGSPAPSAAPAAAPQNALNTAKLVEIVGTQGEQNGA